MESQRNQSESGMIKRIQQLGLDRWDALSDRQRKYTKKIWSVITFKWRWQIAMNIPYLAIFVLDRSIPSVHKFNMDLLLAVSSKLPIPSFLSSWSGLG
ncbi:hypothetical protein EV11_1085 [Prochlorococcus sp. SS52]|nr:hypothetical protein EV04_0030 [Prochlorococcus marinus str. LG]KGG22557.1 hypothetical protein EV08_0072 [Prochlorococcus marinus str. SS2]KGG35811.1 hypothetical protein EV11_1085 [Prochlorococcus sp. SS52]